MRMLIATVVAAAFVLGGCAQIEQTHFMQTQDKVAVPAILAFSQKYPNDVITEIYEQKMFDGSVNYKFVSTGKNNAVHTTMISADGKHVDEINLI